MYKTQKRLTKTGALTLTKDIRSRVGLFPMQGVDVEVTDDMAIIIRKHTPCCFNCGGLENVKSIGKFEICEKCMRKLKVEN